MAKVTCIVVLENGIIVDVGSHEELLERGGLYAKLYNMQFRKQEMEALAEEEEADAGRAAPRGAATPGREKDKAPAKS